MLRGLDKVRHEWTQLCLAWNSKPMAVLLTKSVQVCMTNRWNRLKPMKTAI